MEQFGSRHWSLPLHIATCCLLLVLMSGCSDLKKTFNFTSIDENGNEVTDDIDLPARELLLNGMDDYTVGKYFTAIEFFEEILDKYPFSKEAVLAELKAADCSYHLERYVEARLLYEEFETRHPTNESIPYVMFQKGMCSFKEIDRIDRDTSGAEKAIALFRQLIKAYPDSAYTEVAKEKIKAATEFLADHEYFVVDYYVRTGKYDQAKVRLKYLLAMYPTTDIAKKAEPLLERIENGDPPRSKLTSWFPKLDLPDWAGFWGKDEADTAASPVER